MHHFVQHRLDIWTAFWTTPQVRSGPVLSPQVSASFPVSGMNEIVLNLLPDTFFQLKRSSCWRRKTENQTLLQTHKPDGGDAESAEQSSPPPADPHADCTDFSFCLQAVWTFMKLKKHQFFLSEEQQRLHGSERDRLLSIKTQPSVRPPSANANSRWLSVNNTGSCLLLRRKNRRLRDGCGKQTGCWKTWRERSESAEEPSSTRFLCRSVSTHFCLTGVTRTPDLDHYW